MSNTEMPLRAALRPDRERTPEEQRWPANVWGIGLDRLSLLGVSEAGELHWDGKPIELKKPLVLSLWQQMGAVAVAISAIVAAGAAVVQACAAVASIP